MNPNYQLYYFPVNYLSEIYQNAAYYYNHVEDARIQMSHQRPVQNVLPSIQSVNGQQSGVCKQEFTTKANIKVTKYKKKKENESQISQNSMFQSSEEEINLVSRQKYGRNIISNIVHHMIKKFLTEDFDDLIIRIILRYKLDTNLQQFKQLLGKRSSILGIYLKYAKIKALLKGHEYRNRIKQQTLSKQAIFNKIFRILYAFYLKNVHIMHLFNTLKLKNRSKRYHIEGVSKLLELLHQ